MTLNENVRLERSFSYCAFYPLCTFLIFLWKIKKITTNTWGNEVKVEQRSKSSRCLSRTQHVSEKVQLCFCSTVTVLYSHRLPRVRGAHHTLVTSSAIVSEFISRCLLYYNISVFHLRSPESWDKGLFIAIAITEPFKPWETFCLKHRGENFHNTAIIASQRSLCKDAVWGLARCRSHIWMLNSQGGRFLSTFTDAFQLLKYLWGVH